MVPSKIRSALPFLWLGMILAISFMEAHLKFTAPGITLGLGLGIGRIVFQTLNLMEWTCWALLAITCFINRPERMYLAYLGGLGLLLATQTWILLPILDARALQVIAGKEIPPAPWHWTYIGGDLAKAILLTILGWTGLKRSKNPV